MGSDSNETGAGGGSSSFPFGEIPADESTRSYREDDDSTHSRNWSKYTELPLKPAKREGSIGRIGHYEVQEIVGRGAMGVVVRALDEQLNRTVAIKVMSPQLMSSFGARARFFREAQLAAGISHPNVVTIHAVSEESDLPYLVMEFVQGQTLQDCIRAKAPLPPHDILRISSQVAGGLAAAHQHGVIHRDIKPANIMLEGTIERVRRYD